MASKIIIQHPVSGLRKDGYYGFSWTYFFFGFWVPLFRGEIGIAALHLLFTSFTLGVWQLFMAFLYNKQYMTRMLEKGYVLADTEGNMWAARNKLGIADYNRSSGMPSRLDDYREPSTPSVKLSPIAIAVAVMGSLCVGVGVRYLWQYSAKTPAGFSRESGPDNMVVPEPSNPPDNVLRQGLENYVAHNASYNRYAPFTDFSQMYRMGTITNTVAEAKKTNEYTGIVNGWTIYVYEFDTLISSMSGSKSAIISLGYIKRGQQWYLHPINGPVPSEPIIVKSNPTHTVGAAYSQRSRAALQTRPQPLQTPAQRATYCVTGVGQDDMLNVRAGAGAIFNITQRLPKDYGGIEVTGPSVMNGASEWVPIKFGSQSGWAIKKHLKSEFTQSDYVQGRARETLVDSNVGTSNNDSGLRQRGDESNSKPPETVLDFYQLLPPEVQFEADKSLLLTRDAKHIVNSEKTYLLVHGSEADTCVGLFKTPNRQCVVAVAQSGARNALYFYSYENGRLQAVPKEDILPMKYKYNQQCRYELPLHGPLMKVFSKTNKFLYSLRWKNFGFDAEEE